MVTKKPENYINHIALVLDASYSMSGLTKQVVEVADRQVKHLASRSKELDQETRITVYTFADTVECVFYDMDVLRLPSMKDHYRTRGNTALIDAAIKSQDDLAATAQLYGNHAFLTYVLTDGEENRSRNRAYTLTQRLGELKDNWTVAVLVPDQMGKHEAKKFGFPADNIAIWDTTARGLSEAGDKILVATDNFMTNRSKGIHGSRNIFSTGTDAVNKKTVKANLTPMSKSDYILFEVDVTGPVRPFVQDQGHVYRIGGAYYQLTKTESIQPRKQIAVLEKKTGKVYSGRAARDLVGLPDMEVRVKPDYNKDYDVFVQSTSVNRKLLAGTKLLYLPETVLV